MLQYEESGNIHAYRKSIPLYFLSLSLNLHVCVDGCPFFFFPPLFSFVLAELLVLLLGFEEKTAELEYSSFPVKMILVSTCTHFCVGLCICEA